MFYSYFPVVILFISVFNELDFNFIKIQYFSFNFVHILIFFWTLKNPNHFGYISIFVAGIINDVIIGVPLGISSFCYLLICAVTAYLKNITLSPNFINDWLSFLFTILLINSIQILILNLIFVIEVDYLRYLINTGFTFIFYPLFFLVFNHINKKIIVKLND
ncbi:rod shape-determining protein MreD [Pelagibacterales bacterium SAG-MED03]|nr:rod shape-determining protein MreD [Pelagibacterales bacterium SAG-MED03]